MLRKIKAVGISTILSIILLLKTTTVLAVENQFGKYDLTYYQSLVKSDGGWFDFVDDGITNMMNSIANFLFGINKMIWQGFDMVLKYAFKADIFSDYADMIGKVAKAMYDNLFSTAGMLFFLIVVVTSGITFIKSSPEKALRQFGVSALVIILTGVWFQQSGYYMKVLNGLTNELQADISSAGTISGDKLVNNGKKDSISSASENLRSSYFQMSVEEPYYLMNYGSTDTKVIKKSTNDGKSIDEFLAKDLTQKNADKVKENLDNATYDKNNYLSPDQLPYKMTVGLNATIDTIGFGLIEVIIAILGIVIQFLAVLIDLVLPIFAILSIFPRFSNLFYGGVKGMAMVLLAKASLGLVMLSFRLILLFVDGLIPRSTIGGFIGNGMFKLLMVLVIYLFRRPIETLMKSMTGAGINKFKNEAIPTPINNVISNDPDQQLKIETPELDTKALDKLNSSLSGLTDAIKGNPDLVDDKPPTDEVDEENEAEEVDDSDLPVEADDPELDEPTLDGEDIDTTDIETESELSSPDNVKTEMLEDDEDIQNVDKSKIANLEEYQNLTASNYENNGFDSLEKNQPPDIQERSSFKERLAELETG